MIRKNHFDREVVSDKQFVSLTPMSHSFNVLQFNSEVIMRKHAAVRVAPALSACDADFSEDVVPGLSRHLNRACRFPHFTLKKPDDRDVLHY